MAVLIALSGGVGGSVDAVEGQEPIASEEGGASESGPASDLLTFTEYPRDSAVQALQTGAIDYYIWGLNFRQADPIVNDSSLKLLVSPSFLDCILTNPAPAPEGELNPLSIREVRFALNFLVDRDGIADEAYGGFAAPMVTFLSEYDPDFETIQGVVTKYGFRYDPSTASSIIEEAMIEAGAEKSEDQWLYNGEPVVLKFFIREEDTRREVGEQLALALESVGFSVERNYANYSRAIGVVYQTDPGDLEWHLYTDGYGKNSIDRYDSASINVYGAPWFGNMPGYLQEGWWQYQSSSIDDLGKEIFYGEFEDEEDRDEIYRNCTDLIIQESVRVWVVTELGIYPARSDLEGVTEDPASGLRSLYNFREVYIPGRDEIRIGALYVDTEVSAWNPVWGHTDLYSHDIWSAVHDPQIWNHPFTGSPQPFRWTYTVQTEGPSGSLTVPADAFVWNATSDRWELVGDDVTAKSKVSFDLSKFIGTRWHHNQTITWADVLYTIHQTWEIAYDQEKGNIESAISSNMRDDLRHLKGFRIVGQDLEVYLDYWHFDEDYIADSAAFGVYYPWEVLAAMDVLVFDHETLMYSDLASEKNGVPWMSVNLHDHASLVDGALDELQYSDLEDVFNLSGTAYATEQDLAERVNASHNWFFQRDNMVISDGPFYMEEFNASAGQVRLSAFRDASYPFQKGDWYYGSPGGDP